MVIRNATTLDTPHIISLINDLQDHMVLLDPIGRIRRSTDYGEQTFAQIQEHLKHYEGRCFVAECDGEVIGFISGLIAKQSAENLLSVVPNKLGVIKELFILEKFRKGEIGKRLVTQMEEYFKQAGCDGVWIEVFAPNEKAHAIYNHLGYHDRDIGMLKKI